MTPRAGRALLALSLLATTSESFLRGASFVGDVLALRCGEPYGRRGLTARAAARGDADAYRWRQRSDRLEIVIPVPPATRAAELDVAVTSSHLRVEIAPSDGGRAAVPLVDGQLSAPVTARAARAALTGVGDARALAIGLMKDAPGRWPRLLVGEVPRVAEQEEGDEEGGRASVPPPTASRELAQMTAREMWDELAARGIAASKAASASALADALAEARAADGADGENDAEDEAVSTEAASEDGDATAVAEALETLSPQLAAMLGVEPPSPPAGVDEPIPDAREPRETADPADAAAAAVAAMKQTRRPPPDPSDFDAFYEWVMEE